MKKEVGHLLAGTWRPLRKDVHLPWLLHEGRLLALHISGMLVLSLWLVFCVKGIQSCVCVSHPPALLSPFLSLGRRVVASHTPALPVALELTGQPAPAYPELVFVAPSTSVPPGLRLCHLGWQLCLRPHHLLPQGLLLGQACRPEFWQDPCWRGWWSGRGPADLRYREWEGAAGIWQKAPSA